MTLQPTLADCRLEHVFDIEVLFGADRTLFGPLPGGGHQGYTPAIGGTITGPRLAGSVVPHSGADYATAREDGTIELQPGLSGPPPPRRGPALLLQADALFPGAGRAARLAQPHRYRGWGRAAIRPGPHALSLLRPGLSDPAQPRRGGQKTQRRRKEHQHRQRQRALQPLRRSLTTGGGHGLACAMGGHAGGAIDAILARIGRPRCPRIEQHVERHAAGAHAGGQKVLDHARGRPVKQQEERTRRQQQRKGRAQRGGMKGQPVDRRRQRQPEGRPPRRPARIAPRQPVGAETAPDQAEGDAKARNQAEIGRPPAPAHR
ncbi:hypothetical protein E4T56_gene20226, partial [Termitomyces sp. T112]